MIKILPSFASIALKPSLPKLKGEVAILNGQLCFTDREDSQMVYEEIKKITEKFIREKNTEQNRLVIKSSIQSLLREFEIQATTVVKEKIVIYGETAYVFTEHGVTEYQITPDITDPNALDINFEE